jgi:two-component sensor histidine kinase
VATLAELSRQHTELDASGLAHLQRLMASWGMLSDLCFADLLLFVPVVGGSGSRFIVLGQMRPTTNQTLHLEDLVGRIIDEIERPLVARAWRLGQIVDGEITIAARGERARVQCIPVRYKGDLIAVITRESALSIGRRSGELERVYVEVFERFAGMIVRGEFPFEVDELLSSDAPRVGDGVLLLDSMARVAYSSPNAINAMHRMGIYTNAEGLRLGDLGIDDSVVSSAYEMRTPVTEEVERRSDVIVLMRCIPLLDSDEVTGALILMRDVTDLRRRDRLLLSKDAAIREVHHRVKNNLQTISSLLRLQARRLVAGEGRTALAEAERRIRSIALVHEILSREAGEQVDFNDIVPPLVRMAEDGLLTDRPVEFAVEGEAGELGADVATPLAVVITELLQNAAEHAFPDGAPGDATADTCRVTVNLANDGTNVTVIVSDNGLGLPPDFDVDRTGSLGLSIVRDLVQTQLAGVIEMTSDGGTRVRLQIPVRARPGSDPVRR